MERTNGKKTGDGALPATRPFLHGRTLRLLLATLAFWATDNLHGISAAWIGLAAALICLAPRIGAIEPSALTKLNFGPWFFVAGAISLGAVVRDSGLGRHWEITSSAAALWRACQVLCSMLRWLRDR